MTGRRAAGLLAVLAVGLADAATVEQPRAFGHVLGDVLTQRVLLQHEGRRLTPTAPPPADRVGLWLERRPPRIETGADGRRWLAIDYQVVNAPRQLSTVALPALNVAVDHGPALALPAWPVSIGPLTPPQVAGAGALQPLRPDRAVPPRPTAALEQRLALSLMALAAVALGWLAWWGSRQWRDARRLPYARAARALQRLDPASAEAWRTLHRAIDASAGWAVHSAGLPRLLAEQPHLRPLQASLEAFFRQSDQRFFAGAPAAPPFALRELCAALRRAETREHR